MTRGRLQAAAAAQSGPRPRRAVTAGPVRADAYPTGATQFPIVGIGASAGGLDAFTQFLKHLPVDSGMAFVLIQHLAPSHRSLLGEMLAKSTGVPVSEVRDGQRVDPNHVYVMPAAFDVSIRGGVLLLVPRAADRSLPHLPIDAFFTALAADQGRYAIGAILSGTASDGTEGLRAIKSAGGITLVQDPRTAKFGGMPNSAVEAGVVDYSLSISALASELGRLSKHPYLTSPPPPPFTTIESGTTGGQRKRAARPGMAPDQALVKIMDLVKTVAGVDFREYKLATFERRLARRMALRRVEAKDRYLLLLENDADEARALCEDTLIHVSSFFRDPEVFEQLKATVFPALLKSKREGSTIRVWVAGCSTGEEVYSLAICLLEFLVDAAALHPLQIFGSDVSEVAIQAARAGNYSPTALRDVSDERRRRYFTKTEEGFRINKAVRDLCVFVRHDLARDPPFTKLDLLSCRNVLIYFDQPLQNRVLPTFHYSLNQPGFLLLGRTENIAGFGQLFSSVHEGSKIFARSGSASTLRFPPRPEAHGGALKLNVGAVAQTSSVARQISPHLNNLLLARYAPPGVLINDKLEILQFCGRTGAYLQPAAGEPQNNVFKMARPGLLAKLRMTLTRAKKEMAPVRTSGVEVDQGGFTRTCAIVALPFTGLPEMKEPLFVVLFEEEREKEQAATHPRRLGGRSSGAGKRARTKAAHDARRIPTLEHELSATTEYLNSLVEEHSRTTDDLGSANEELVSGNEELQSLNEELETAKEELQSTNEELTTVNDELHHRNIEVGQINADLVNLLNTVDTPIVILDRERRVRRFTPNASNLLNILPTDVGRPFDDIKPKLDVPDLDEQIARVIATLKPEESEIQDRQGHWYRMQVRPYQAPDDSGDGAVLSLVDIDVLKHHLHDAQHGREAAELADRAKDQFLAVLSHEVRTPLTALVMQTHLLRQWGHDTVKRTRACDAIERSTEMQVQLIDDLLDVSRIVTGKLRVDLQRVDLVAIVKTTMDNVAPMAAAKGIELSAFLQSELGPIAGDRIRLEQAVSNLLINAIKFTPRGGRVDVSLQTVAGAACLKVTDNGMGIKEDFLPQIFDRLTQSDSSTTRAHSGLGLGLAIVRHLVEAHGGNVRAESGGPGHGATFYVNLPLMTQVDEAVPPAAPMDVTPPRRAPRRAAQGALPAGVIVAGLTGRRVLVVEDDPEISEVLAEILVDGGATVWTAASAAAGMKEFERLQPDALLCDIAMPGEDGYAFIRRIRALRSAQGGQTPAMALTALATDNDRLRALSEGFQMYVAKPVEIQQFIASVEQLLSTDWSFPTDTSPPAGDSASN